MRRPSIPPTGIAAGAAGDRVPASAYRASVRLSGSCAIGGDCMGVSPAPIESLPIITTSPPRIFSASHGRNHGTA